MSTTGFSFALGLVERGYVPDALVSMGIRNLNQKRLSFERLQSTLTNPSPIESFVEAMRQAPIAYSTEKANEQHYELPADFFLKTLGRHLKYSSCYYPEGVSTLDDAEAAMLRLSCERAGLQDGMDILELGCGWGSLTLWMAEHYPNARISAVSNSHSQREFIERTARDKNLTNIRIITADMNDFDIDGAFDRVMSIEMFEHMRNHEELLRRVAGWLRPQGKVFIHVFCHRRFAYLFEAKSERDWMGKYFFTGGMMPSFDLFSHFQRDLKIEEEWYVNGEHYSRTAAAWLDNMDRHKSEIMPILEDVYGQDVQRWFVRWRLFFLACKELFGYAGGDEWGVGHYRFIKQ